MNDQTTNPFAMPDLGAMSDSAKSAIEAMSKTYMSWFKNANRVQAEAIRFLSDRFAKDLALASRFGACRKPEDFVAVQSEVATELVKDYMEESAKFVALFGDAFKDLQANAAGAPKK
ncbi:MAG TPA: phasin family protein [Rudaea sp.]|nr:phasin family protein [Rudaea sp.]